jgi:uncharacterized peroxidase-related enzyme
MAKVKLLEKNEVNGETKVLFEQIEQEFGMIPNLFKALAHKPNILKANLLKVQAVMYEGELKRELKEMIAVVVSNTNGCQYCVGAHSLFLEKLGMSKEVIELLLIDFKTAPIDEDTKHILEFAVQITKEPLNLSDESFSKIQALGFNDAQIVEMISVVDLFNSFNIFLDALSVDLDF